MTAKRKGKRVEHDDGTVTVHGKNPNGDGSVYQISDGRWVATWTVPGRKHPRKATGKTRDEAVKRRAQRMGQPVSVDGIRTLSELADWWLHHVHKGKVARSSWGKAEDRVRRIKSTLGTYAPADITYPVVVEWQTDLLAEPLAAKTVQLHRQTLAQVMDEAVKLELAPGNPVHSVEPPKVNPSPKVALTSEQVAALAKLAAEHRLGAAVMILFLQGWRVSEVLGLAWEDLDLKAGTAKLQRVSVYVDGVGQVLEPRAKTEGTHGVHWLAPTVATLLNKHRKAQAKERETAANWKVQRCDGRKVDLMFTTRTGGLILRQTVTKAVKKLAEAAGIDAELVAQIATHSGRRTVVTVMYEGDVPIDDIARHVGHALPSTTAQYVKRLGKRPQHVAARAAALLDPEAKKTA